jgi:hypothetical protein
MSELKVGDKVRLEDWVTSQHLYRLGISDLRWVQRFLSNDLLIFQQDDGVWRDCGRVAQVMFADRNISHYPFNLKVCYLRRVE